MALGQPVLMVSLLAFGLSGCAGPGHAQPRAQAPTFAQAAPRATLASSESWASVLPLPGIEPDARASARRDVALGLAPAGFTRSAGDWPAAQPGSVERYFLVPLPRSQRTFLFFSSSTTERRAPRPPQRADPWRTAW